ncbi:BlaI/MecI/CopY family transcriptional regulator [Jiangella sp. DSM 45060]|uniref:BlaI/MecI/CopY family transcriptional regulator n=1 Tax=Jiangella sp. DSM 45060 TaxID=1798224 RepID=UPI00087A7D01|nr:BlaI/MecI/CopY family transcriptional regulator [Jiangella sp. DSM 45060]SDS53845.1 Predicted transcriptional regulator [Jiangella sp. DSM 45060]
MRPFGALEAAIMKVVWSAAEPITIREIKEQLPQQPERAYTTVQTVVDILYRKGWLGRARDGKAHRYVPSRTRDDYTAALLGAALTTTTDRTGALLRLVGTMNDAEVAALRAALDAATTDRGSPAP